ncbi:hypothetical protein Cni_G01964 [Canna indica]|uniref:Homeobox-leucine zipper protein n=1 Tax=Canna indica TaxID=4628 RepID=A0AAQ3JQG6_9LILI|nr:hypothetical protein Cni_G01964 [Canna indica]
MSIFSSNYLLQMNTQHEEEEDESEEYQFRTPIRPPFNNHQDHRVLGKRCISFSGFNIGEDAAADELPEDKKRRLSKEQVRLLEKNFELGNKLESERKLQLARALGMQPRQVAIWFQNRRARWKTKQLEKDFELLKRQFEATRAENEALKSHNKKLHSQILALKGRSETSELINLNKETEASCSNRSENSSEINLETPFARPHHHHHQNLQLFQSIRAGETEQLLQSSSRPEAVQCPKIEGGVNEGLSFGNLLCNMEDQSASFWQWPDHHNFH